VPAVEIRLAEAIEIGRTLQDPVEPAALEPPPLAVIPEHLVTADAGQPNLDVARHLGEYRPRRQAAAIGLVEGPDHLGQCAQQVVMSERHLAVWGSPLF